MTDVIAKTRIKGKDYEILVDLERALKFKKGEPVGITEVLVVDKIFHDYKKGLHVPEADLKTDFGTNDSYAVAAKIVKQGDIQIPKGHRDKEREDKKKQIVDFLTKFAVDPRTGTPHTPDRISSVLDQAGINIDNKPVEQQISKIIEKIKTILPIKIQTKRLKIIIPAEYTGRLYGIVQEHKESENWLGNGNLEVVINLPLGLQEDFYDKINSITHGSVMSQEMK